MDVYFEMMNALSFSEIFVAEIVKLLSEKQFEEIMEGLGFGVKSKTFYDENQLKEDEVKNFIELTSFNSDQIRRIII